MKEKILTIDSREVKFTVDGAFPLTYREETNRDYFTDVFGLITKFQQIQRGDDGELNSDVLYDIIYLLAKNANPDITAKLQWFKSFGAFPVMDIFTELQDLLLLNMHAPVNKIKKK